MRFWNQFLNTKLSASTENESPCFLKLSVLEMPLTTAIATATIKVAKNNNVVPIIVKF